LVALLHCMLINFSHASDALVNCTEVFLSGESPTSDDNVRAEDGGVAWVERLLRAADAEADATSAAKLFDSSQIEVLNLTWNSSPFDLDAVRNLEAGAGTDVC